MPEMMSLKLSYGKRSDRVSRIWMKPVIFHFLWAFNLLYLIFILFQGCAQAEPSGLWRLTFALRLLENLIFFIQIIIYAGHPRFYSFGALGSLQFSLEDSLVYCQYFLPALLPALTFTLKLLLPTHKTTPYHIGSFVTVQSELN